MQLSEEQVDKAQAFLEELLVKAENAHPIKSKIILEESILTDLDIFVILRFADIYQDFIKTMGEVSDEEVEQYLNPEKDEGDLENQENPDLI